MKKIKLDTGVSAVALGGGTLRYHPADPNLYVRFREAAQKLQDMEQDLGAKKDLTGEQAAALLHAADRQMKDLLGWVFGPGNDFDKIVDGVNLLAVASNGERVVTNLFAALEPLLVEGAKACAAAVAGK